jgi:hypothetical protein
MKIKSDVRAGMTFAECDSQRNWYKNQVKSGRCNSPVPNPQPWPQPQPQPQPNGGGWVGGVWVSDQSGSCGW